jgi:hypothetical protein
MQLGFNKLNINWKGKTCQIHGTYSALHSKTENIFKKLPDKFDKKTRSNTYQLSKSNAAIMKNLSMLIIGGYKRNKRRI